MQRRTRSPYIHGALYAVMGEAYRHLGQLEQAAAMYQSARSADPDLTYALSELAETYYEMGQYEPAIQAWRGCLAEDPGSPTAYYPKMAQAYRQMDDLSSEEQAWRDLLQAQERRGLLDRLGRQTQSIFALTKLADCLQRQNKTEEWLKVKRRIERARPHHDDPFEDWAYWLRDRLERKPGNESLLGTLRDSQDLMPEPVWSQVLQACVYDWLEQPEQSAPLWQNIRRQIAGTPRRWVLTQARGILGDLLPRSSQLFDLIKEG